MCRSIFWCPSCNYFLYSFIFSKISSGQKKKKKNKHKSQQNKTKTYLEGPKCPISLKQISVTLPHSSSLLTRDNNCCSFILIFFQCRDVMFSLTLNYLVLLQQSTHHCTLSLLEQSPDQHRASFVHPTSFTWERVTILMNCVGSWKGKCILTVRSCFKAIIVECWL